jgi:hypothetical protein
MHVRLICVTIAMFGSTAAPASHEVRVTAHASAAGVATPPCGPGIHLRNAASDSRCFELRIYTLEKGSSADVLHARFRERTIALFEKHGMTVIGFWQPVARPDQLVYMLAFRDAAEGFRLGGVQRGSGVGEGACRDACRRRCRQHVHGGDGL